MNARKSNITILTILFISVLIVATAAPAWAVGPEPPTPFLISGEVNYDTGESVPNPTVTVKNTNTLEVFVAEISENSYRVSTDSTHVSAGDVLHFNASNDNVTECDHTVNETEMDAGGFVQDIIINHPGALKPDLIVTDINSYHNNSGCPAWFNVSNEIDVTVKNDGDAAAGASSVSLHIEDVFYGKLPVSNLAAGASETVTFEDWVPIGDDCLQEPCVFEWSYADYNLTGVADCDNAVAESDEENNETTVVARACYNGYTADEPLENVNHGVLHGGFLFTTGDGTYGGLYSPSATKDTNYDITLPDGATVELAQLNVYYTWTSPDHACPEMEVRITNATGTYVVPLEKAYNDIKCTCPGASWIKSWGNYVFDLTDYITGSGAYTVTVENVGSSGHSFCIAAPGLALVYEDETAPLIEYWVNTGADVLMGGRRYPTSSNLAWWECTNNATFPASTETGDVVNATLGVVAPWGDSIPDDILFLNEIELGRGVYNGYSSLYSKAIDSLSMYVGASGNAQVGANVTSVTAQYLQGSANMVGQADDGDNIMACNAFLVVEYESVVQEPDLIVEAVVLNPDCEHYYFANESNVVNVTVKNIGAGAAGASHVKLNGASGDSASVAVGALAADASEEVSITDTIARPVGEQVIAIADCDGEVTESNETNNESAAGTVINHGLKGKTYTGGESITTEMTYELNGNLVYSVGDSEYVSGYDYWTHYTANWTETDLPIPGTATVEEARLYAIYTWDKADVMPDNVSMSFNGVNQEPEDKHYWDKKGFGYYNLPYGMLAYDVTSDFEPSGNSADLTKTPSSTQVSMRGMLLVVIYEDANEPQRLIFVNEEFDNLYGDASYCTTPDEATAWAPITGPTIDTSKVMNATLITVAPGAGPNEGELLFNGQTWTNVWNFAANTQIGIDERDVKTYLDATDNEAGFQSSEDWMEASNAFLVVEYETEEEPDLVVSAIEPNCGGYLFGNESNELCAEIDNIGGVDATAFNVSFVVDGFNEEVRIEGLAAGTNTTVCVNDTTLRNAGDAVTITVTADCNAEVAESNETNNTSTLSTTVVNNGYKGKRYTGGEDITTWETFELNGDLLYSVGDSAYVSGSSGWATYDANWTASDLLIPGTASIETARLFVPYTWDKDDVMPDNVTLSFNGETQILAAHYSDRKDYNGYNYPYGMLVYDVTDDFNTGGNSATLTKSESGTAVSMRGMLLVVIYEDDNEPVRKIILNEEFDMLYGGSSKCTTPEEATAYAPLGAIDLAGLEKATLITVAPGADGPEGDLLFNGHAWTDVWNSAGSSQIGINETDVAAYLDATANEAGFQSSADYMEASNAFLVLEYGEEPIVSYGKSVRYTRNVQGSQRAVGEPNNIGAVMYRDSEIALELKKKIPDCEKVSVWVRRSSMRPPPFEVGVSSDGSTWTTIGTETCYSFAWTRYDFTGDWDNVKYIAITKPGGFWRPQLMGLDAVSAEGW